MSAWIELDTAEYDRIWAAFEEKFEFKPHAGEADGPAFLEPAASATWSVGAGYGERRAELEGDLTVSYCTVVWSASGPQPLSKGRRYGWKSRRMGFPRQATFECGWALRVHSNLTTYRAALEKSLIAGRRGIGRCGADFWSVLKDKRGRSNNLLGTLMGASWHGGNIRKW